MEELKPQFSKSDRSKITKAFLVNFGNFFLLPKAMEKEAASPFVPESEVKSLIESVKKQLQPPIFKEVKTLHSHDFEFFNIYPTRRTVSGSASSLEAVTFSPLISCKIALPLEDQGELLCENYIHGETSTDATTEFQVLFDGAIYMIIREIDLGKCSHPGIIDARNAFFDALENETFWKWEEYPPDPIGTTHTLDLVFVFLVEDEKDSKLMGRVFLRDYCIYSILPTPPDEDFTKVFGSTFADNSPWLLRYYTTLISKQRVNDITERIVNLQDEIQYNIRNAPKSRLFNVYRHYRQSRTLEDHVLEHYSLVIDYANEMEKLIWETTNTQECIEETLFQHSKEKLIRELKPREIDIERYSKYVEKVKETIGESYTIKITLIGAILTVIGAIAGALAFHHLGF